MPSLLPPACRIKHSQRGFTLIELLIVVAIISLLAAIGYPRYTAYVERSLRSDAHAGLLQAASEMERCYSQNYAYTDECGRTGISPDDNYDIELETDNTDDGGFTLKAVSRGRDDGCDSDITLNALGERKPEECW